MQKQQDSQRAGIVAVVMFVLCALSASAGPAPAGSVGGVVLDPSGGAIPKARVALLTASDHEIGSTLTDDTGYFQIDCSNRPTT